MWDRPVGCERGGDTLFRIVKEVEVIAVARRIWSEVHRRAPGKVAVVGWCHGKISQQDTLKFR